MKAILALCLALFLISIHAAVLPKKSLQLKMHKTSEKAVKTRQGTYKDFNNRHVLANRNATLANYADATYAVNVTLGTPGQTIALIVDTASAVMFVYACNEFITLNCFNSNLSSTYSFKGTDLYNNTYGQDVFNLVGFTANSQVFELFNFNMSFSHALAFDGILGLAWPSLAPYNYTPPIQNLLSQFDKPVFSIWLDRKGNNSDQAGGLLTLGAVDTQNCDSNVQYVPLTSLSLWQFSISAFSVGSYTKTKTTPVFVDSNSDFLGVPPDAMKAIASATNAAYSAESNFYSLPCNATGLPDLKFTIKNQIYSVSQSEYISDFNYGNGTCLLAIYSVDNGGFGPSWTLGQPFMRSYCNFFDVGNKMIGFSKPKHSGF